MALPDLVARLPELYQPIFGHADLGGRPSRGCEDRLEALRAACGLLAGHLGRRLRVLDLGCAQGYFTLSLAADGHEATGVDLDGDNIAVCRALGAESALAVAFEQGDAVDYCSALEPDKFDVVLGLSVFHHVCHQKGADFVRALLSAVGDRCELLLAEVALATEPMYWAAAQPQNPRFVLEDFPFVRALGHFPTHLSDVRRPLYAASKRVFLAHDLVMPFWHASPLSHPMVGSAHQGTRWYFYGKGFLAKVVRTQGPLGPGNVAELQREAEFLRRDPPVLPDQPALASFGMGEEDAWIVRGNVDGKLLSDAIQAGDEMQPEAVVLDILGQLARLEKAGLYHSDLRCWNVLYDGKRARVIDYGSIVEMPVDCAWPTNIFLSLFAFVAEVANRRIYTSEPVGRVMISPFNVPAPFRPWLERAWEGDPAKWTFAGLLRDYRLLVGADGTAKPVPVKDESAASDLWMGAMERVISDLARHHAALAQAVHQGGAAAAPDGARIAALEGELARAGNVLTELRTQHAAMMGERQAVAGQLTELQALHCAAAERATRAQAERDAAQEIANAARMELALVQKELSQLRALEQATAAKLGQAQADRQRAQEESQRLRGEQGQALARARAELAAAAENGARLRDELAAAAEDGARLRDELAAAAGRSEGLQQEMQRVRADLEAANREVGRARAHRDTAVDRSLALQAEMEAAQARQEAALRALEERAVDAERRLAAALHEVGELRKSWSWKAMAPARTIGGWLGKPGKHGK